MRITVRALPRSFDAEHRRAFGEGIFCCRWDALAGARGLGTCTGMPEVELALEIRDETIVARLCREHAGDVARQLVEAIELVDGGEILRVRPS